MAQQAESLDAQAKFKRYFAGPGSDAVDDFLDRYDYERVANTYAEPIRVDWQQLRAFDDELAGKLQQHPKQYADHAESALRDEYSVEGRNGPASVRAALRVRNLPDEHTHAVDLLRGHHLDRLVAVDVEIIKVEPVNPMLTEAAYECKRCGTMTYIPQRPYAKMREPEDCMSCEEEGPFRLSQSRSEFEDCQLAKCVAADPILEEPRKLRLFLRNDLCGRLRKKETLTVVGVYRILPFDHPDQKRTNMETYLDALSLDTDDVAQVGRMDAAELGERIVDYVADHEPPEETDDGEWYVDRGDVEEHITASTNASESDVAACINDLVDDNELIPQARGRLATT